MTSGFLRGENRDTHKRRPYKDDRAWNYASMSPGMPRIAGNNQKLEEAGKDPPLESSERAQFYQQLDSVLLTSRTLVHYISVVLSHQICNMLFR